MLATFLRGDWLFPMDVSCCLSGGKGDVFFTLILNIYGAVVVVSISLGSTLTRLLSSK